MIVISMKMIANSLNDLVHCHDGITIIPITNFSIDFLICY